MLSAISYQPQTSYFTPHTSQSRVKSTNQQINTSTSSVCEENKSTIKQINKIITFAANFLKWAKTKTMLKSAGP